MTSDVDTKPAGDERVEGSRAALAVVLLAQFATPLSIAGVAVGLPTIAADLGAHPTALQWVVNSFNVMFAVSALAWGTVGDRFGHTSVFRWGVALALAGALASAVAPDLLLLDLARALAGVGAGAVISSASAILSRSFSGASRSTAFALFGAANGLGLAAGPSISGGLVSAFGWQAVFIAHALLLAPALLGSRVLPRSTDTAPVDTATVDALPADAAGTAPTSSGSARALLRPGFLAMLVVPVAGAAGFVTLMTYFPAALQAVRGDSPGAAGALMLAMSAPVLFAPLLVHRVAPLLGREPAVRVSVVALVLLVLGPLGLISFDADAPLPLVLALFVVTGLGFGLPLGVVDGHALAQVPGDAQGLAAGVLNTFRIGSEALFVALYGIALSWGISRRPIDPALADGIAAGRSGHADIYLGALHPVLFGIAALGTAFLAVFLCLSAAARRHDGE